MTAVITVPWLLRTFIGEMLQDLETSIACGVRALSTECARPERPPIKYGAGRQKT